MHRSRAALWFARMVPSAVALALTTASASAQNSDPAKLAKDLKSPDRDVRYQATFDLNRCGAGCRSAVPALIEMFQKSGDGEERSWALTAVSQIIRAEGYTAESPEAARVAKQADCSLILPVLTHPGPGAGGNAGVPLIASAGVLGACGGKAEVSSLVPMLKDESAAVRQAAVTALIEIGPPAREAVPALQPLLKDPEPSVQQLAAAAIKKIGAK